MHFKGLISSKKPGFAVPMAVITVMLLFVMGVSLLGLGFSNRVYSVRNISDMTARCAADSGLIMALFEMNEKLKVTPWNGESLPEAKAFSLPYCNAVCSYTVSGDLGGGYIIKAAGESGHAKRTVIATVKLKGLYDNALLTSQNLILKAGTKVIGYNSADPLDTCTDADIASQSCLDSSILLNMGVVVDGDVRVGVTGNPETGIKDLGAKITGIKHSMTEEEPLADITIPTSLPAMGSTISSKGKTVTLTPTESGTYSGIDLKTDKQPGVVEIKGGHVELHITGDIELGQSCEIVVKDGSSLTLYVDGDIHCRENSGINTENSSKNSQTLTLYGTSDNTQTFDLKAKSEWVGVIYAPNADVDLYAGGDAYGAVVAGSFEFKAGGNYYYDRALKKVSIEDEGVRFVVNRWQEE